MKVLLDACVWRGAGEDLRAAGHDVEWAGDWGEDPGDAEILRRAHDASQVLVTLDKDFGELAVVHRLPHHGIIRLVGFGAREQGEVCATLLDAYADDLSHGALLTATPGRVRIRPAGS
jgi:predicted nuclease of predicted toxin-antitoxin system